MKNRSSALSLLLGVAVLAPAFIGTGCNYLTGDCELMLNCDHFLDDDGAIAGAPGDGDGDTGGRPGDGDGDGDGDDTGGKTGDGDGDGDGDSGGTGGGGGDGDGDGDTGGNGSGGAAEPCDGACEGSAPLCDEETEMCVQCLDEGDCSEVEGKPACRIDHSCVECVATPDCRDAEKPVCDGAKNECVECFAPEHCGNAEKPVCDTNDGSCVGCLSTEDCAEGSYCEVEGKTCEQCLTDSHCGDPTLARCDTETNLCVGCTESTQCEGIEGKTVCDIGAAECVECTGTEYSVCGTNGSGEQLVCDSLNRTCSSDRVVADKGLCAECITDAECSAGQSCVMQQFEGFDVGHFCFWKKGGEGGAPESCLNDGRPFVSLKPMATSIDEVSADICGLRVTTCKAMNEFGSPDVDCVPTPEPEQSVCGEPGLSDAYCRIAATSPDVYRCTVPCGSSDDCKEEFECDTEVSPQVCNLNP